MVAAASSSVVDAAIVPVDLSRIYDCEQPYNLPRPALESFFDGRAFDHKVAYTDAERTAVEADIQAIWDRIVESKPTSKKQVLVTAGAPGAGKTTLLEDVIERRPGLVGVTYGYIDPDAVCLKQMKHTYQADLAQGLKELENLTGADRVEAERQLRQDLYDKWRPASNAINHWILANMSQLNWDLAVGTTSSSPYTAGMYKHFKKLGYEIEVLHVSASDDTRWASIRERDNQFVQTTEVDVREKGRMIYERIHDTFFAEADHVRFYHRNQGEAATPVATWDRSDVKPGEDAKQSVRELNPRLADVVALHGENW